MLKINKDYINTILNGNKNVYFYGISEIAKLSISGMDILGVKINGIFDSNVKISNNEIFEGIPILEQSVLSNVDKGAHIIITCSHFITIERYLNSIGFYNIYDHCFLIESVINKDILSGTSRIIAERTLLASQEKVKHAIRQFDGKIIIPSIDVIVTEKCTLKCADCANLMPYFATPKNLDFELIMSSLDNIFSVTDMVIELRILGGEPFILKNIEKIINYCTAKNVNRVVIYTNATIIPQTSAIDAMKHKNVFVEITDYGKLSRATDKIKAIFDQEGIFYSIEQLPDTWDDSADIIRPERTKDENQHIFDTCCAKYLYTLMHGRLYRCPFSASLNSIDSDLGSVEDYVDLTTDQFLKTRLQSFIYSPNYVPSCKYCKGRSQVLGRVDPARQAEKKRIPFITIE
jgi:organic radical activating enzyme